MEENDRLLELTISMCPGQLADLINTHKAQAIRTLKLEGGINGSDVRTIRMMTHLQELDLTGVAIVSGGEPYYEEFVVEDNIIGEHFMHGHTHLMKVLLPDTVTTIKSHAFADCTSLRAISIPEGVCYIGSCAFSGCASLKDVIIEDGEEDLDFSTCADEFKDCPIESVYLGRDIFYTYEDMVEMFNGLEYVYETQLSPFMNKPSLTSVVCGRYVTNIPEYAFYNCKNLDSVYVRGVIDGGYNDFFCCGGISRLILSEGASYSDWLECCSYFSRIVFTDDVRTVNLENMEFYCKSVSEIQLMCSCPPVVKGKAAEEVGKHKCTLIVPAGSADKYRNACYWKDFGNIIELD